VAYEVIRLLRDDVSYVTALKRGFHPTQRTQRTQHNGRNATNGTDATTDDYEASDRFFDTPSFIIILNCSAFVFFNIALIVIYSCLFSLYVADD